MLPSWLLYVIIFAGTLACFDKELERWMRPALHEAAPASMTADQVRDWLQRNVKDELHAFWMHGPTEREPYWRLGWEVLHWTIFLMTLIKQKCIVVVM